MMRHLLRIGAAIVLLHALSTVAHEGEDHGAAPAAAVPTPATGPRLEAATPDLELVAVLQEDRLIVYLDHYATNAPVSEAKVEIDGGQHRAVAEATAEGTYAAHAPWLTRPGMHSLVFTVQSEEVSDLLAGTLEVPAPSAEASDRRPGGAALLAGAGGAGLLLLIGAWTLLRRRHNAAGLALVAAALLSPDATLSHEGEVHDQDKAASAPGAAAMTQAAGAVPARLPDGSVYVPKSAQRLLRLRTTVAQVAEIPQAVELFGHVVADPNASGRVQASQAGRVEPGPRGLPYLGQRVKKGDVLAYLVPVAASIERGNQQAQLAELESALAIATAKSARYEQLEGSIPRKEIEAARTEMESLRARREAVAASLYRREPLTAPVSGVVSAMAAASGQVVEAREVLFDIIDPARLWVEAVAYDMGLHGRIAGARAVGQAGEPVSLTFLGAGYQLREQALPLQFRLEPPLPPVSVGEKMMLYVQTRQRVRGVALPQVAVTRNASGEMVAWVHASAERFTPRRVRTVSSDGTSVVVVEGLTGGERVVTEGAAMLAQVR